MIPTHKNMIYKIYYSMTRLFLLGVVLLTLSACGGGGSTDESTPQDPSLFSVTAEASEGGLITPSVMRVASGESAAFTLSPETGHTLMSVTGCSGSLSGNTYTTRPITQTCTVNAVFAKRINPNSRTSGQISPAGDNDFFQINLTSAGTLTVYTTGSTDTFGYLLNSSGQQIESNDDISSSNLNFRISRQLAAGTYYVRVRHFSSTGTGAYTLVSEFSGSSTSEETGASCPRETVGWEGMRIVTWPSVPTILICGGILESAPHGAEGVAINGLAPNTGEAYYRCNNGSWERVRAFCR